MPALLHLWPELCTKKVLDMNAFKVPLSEGNPSKITDFKIDLHSSSGQVFENSKTISEKYVVKTSDSNLIIYKDAPLHEGYLNVYLCYFDSGKYFLHIFGRINNSDFRTEKVIDPARFDSTYPIAEKIKYVLTHSKNILRKFYQECRVKSLEEYLLNAFAL